MREYSVSGNLALVAKILREPVSATVGGLKKTHLLIKHQSSKVEQWHKSLGVVWQLAGTSARRCSVFRKRGVDFEASSLRCPKVKGFERLKTDRIGCARL
jgi:hypothetical protein